MTFTVQSTISAELLRQLGTLLAQAVPADPGAQDNLQELIVLEHDSFEALAAGWCETLRRFATQDGLVFRTFETLEVMNEGTSWRLKARVRGELGLPRGETKPLDVKVQRAAEGWTATVAF